jgi:transposase
LEFLFQKEQRDMASIPVFVGLDYHDSVVQVCVVEASGAVLGNRPCQNQLAAITAYVEQFGSVVRAGIEACTGSADLAEKLVQYGWSVDLAHPGYVSRMKQNPDKTDFGDARMLADLERVGYLPRVWLAPEETRELRRLIRYRQTLVNERRNARQRMRAILREHRLRLDQRAWTRSWLAWVSDVRLAEQSRWIMDQLLGTVQRLNQEIRAVEKRLEQVTREDVLVKRLLDQKGIGPVTAWAMRAEIGRFDRFRSGKQLSRFCGLTPRNASSGQRQADAGLIRAGNPELRAVLIEAAQRLRRCEPRWREFSARLLQAGKAKSVVTAAVANRWIRWLFHEMQAA